MNKWKNAAIPALLIHCSIGSVYCWSTFKETIADQIGASVFSVGWAFSLAIFFLGTSAAFAGRIVEMDIHKATAVALCCFSLGMIGTGFVVGHLHGAAALSGIYIFYGAIMGIGLGIGYLSPVKTLMLWFPDQKGLATGLSIMGFGLAKAIATPVMEFLQSRFGISWMFYILGCVYFVMMFVGHLLLKKPEGWVEDNDRTDFDVKELLHNRTFIAIWLIFYLNIHCGLMLISNEKQITGMFIGAWAVALVPSITAIWNALGRIGYASLSDNLPTRAKTYSIIFASSFALTFIGGVTENAFMIFLLLVVVNAGYGGGFSTLPALLSERFGMKDISKIHGIALTAWSVAGLTGNNLSELIFRWSGDYSIVIGVTVVLYLICFDISRRI